MKIKGEQFKIILYRLLSFENYLLVISRLYFVSFYLGLLKKNKIYAYPYFLNHIVKENDAVIDIGANLGYMTNLFCRLVKDKGIVYAVEPIAPIVKVLRRNTRKFKNLQILPYALGVENKHVKLGNNSLLKRKFVATGSNFIIDSNITEDAGAEIEFQAEMRKGSELFRDLTRLDFIKIDVEGYEMIVVSEMEPVIMKFRPAMLIETKREKRKQMMLYLGERNYSAFVLHGNLLYPTDETENWDILFIPGERLEKYSGYIKDFSPKQ